ncbi:fumarylacetoacetate hydrolase family protein [Puniceibacterium sp. IMCC21224]|uniref:fumarylacetoacetate hydrolase family protein n=1 Tax=Puniceibacterium sp. IMCC21224 TaxID=1618204 RepID=UPI00064DAD93|nr:fumarylacetoacetate hydrolase family protein [Puniceibacterium sp. IMCC21224]KMK65165.1 2-keto-4-pentenoate hydratase/2-oxohepta-3-ene-1,7-dioic acid hydratase [Puniceibacterium sp. IMCC21224]
MKLVSFAVDGAARYGLVRGEGVYDLSTRLPPYRDIVDFMTDGSEQAALAAIGDDAPDHALADLTLLPVVPNPGKIVCIGLNYQAHKAEGVRDPNDKPMLFARWADTLIGHDAPMLIPKISDKLDFEAEMVAIIGKPTGRNVQAADALPLVYGYTCMNEGSVRDWQRHSSQVTAGKNFVGTGPVGPWIVTANELGDPQALDLELTVNGTTMQRANTADMIWPVAEMIEYITNWMPLNPGDMIATGTPAGVGSRRDPPVFLKPGDVVEVTIQGIGTLRNTVAKES